MADETRDQEVLNSTKYFGQNYIGDDIVINKKMF